MNHRETIRRREPRATALQKGVLASIRPKIHAYHPGGHYKAGDQVVLKIEDCSPAGLKMFCYSFHVAPCKTEKQFTTLTNGMTFKTKEIERLFHNAGVKQEDLQQPKRYGE